MLQKKHSKIKKNTSQIILHEFMVIAVPVELVMHVLVPHV